MMMNGRLYIDVLRKRALTLEMDTVVTMEKTHLKMKRIMLVNTFTIQRMKVKTLTGLLLKTDGC
jgi:hypothetical protein